MSKYKISIFIVGDLSPRYRSDRVIDIGIRMGIRNREGNLDNMRECEMNYKYISLLKYMNIF